LIAQDKNRHVCGTDHYFEQLCKNDPSILLRQQEAENLVSLQNSPMEGMATVKIIPVVFHIIHTNGSENIPDAAIYDQLQRINEDFRKKNSDTTLIRTQFKSLATDMGIEFRLARKDPQGNCTNGITRYYSELTVNAGDNVKSLPGQFWDTKKYLNVWIVNSINSSGSIGTILGYAYFPWNAGTSVDGVLIRADRIGNDERTLTHEIGHYLGLYHPFQGGCANSDCSSNGDRVCDTPPVAEMNFGCNKSTNSCNTESPDQYDMIENYMDYADCSYLFTKGQGTRVQTMIQNYRSNLYSTANLQATGVFDTNNISCKVVANFTAETFNVCAGSAVKFINGSFVSSAVQYVWEFEAGNPPVSFQKNETVTYNTPGKYNVKLVVKNSLGNDSITKNDVVVIYPKNGFNTPFSESFESADLTNGYWVLDDPIQNIGWYRNNKAASTGSYSFYVNNFQNEQKDLSISFTLPPVNFTGITAPLLTFMHSFAAISSTHSDKLKVYASDDCGVTWYPRYTKISTKLPTTSTYYTTEFVPNNSGLWEYNQVDMSFFQNKPNVLIRFEFTTGLGNNLYIDDILVGVATDIENKTNDNEIEVYPNPVSGKMYIRLPSDQNQSFTFNIIDLLGNIIYVTNISSASGNDVPVQLSDAGITKNGTYIVRILTKDKIFTKRITVID
jgi:PKD repeat protein